MFISYPAIIHEEDGYWVEFPDLPGCQTQGDTLTETLQNASEALEGYISLLAEEDRSFPAPSDAGSIIPEEGFVNYIYTDFDPYKNAKAVKKTLTIPDWVDHRARQKGLNFSRILTESLIHLF